ncbi:MAG: dimethylarginine dimethylaminohydrolase family protein [Clostridium sp.]|jgi:N-dimethylarginine dimethylaminohydrolase|uniref:dimethylarginine dimethylaminohydrolase family protein n=1 Tax=Clostridium sp. TaxID=1506 RepID=UPI0025C2FAEA|nr:dimethylarginine dimethylaminohydrolase family protein [Clostridium sp.]MCH3964866.1 dimethylarginine dimethylaminohydrolase family protein [Clostridium sp.]MCI1716639.1 dimethylarginine dimethylaminohydrolase family protein [Clostridium sp.]MCI1800879.1 dimethylarginine dimethylaminohydrolase family protein [Clostridium sp.]MCI1814816.1 dimethylarginine dimethylaminohydrolase family protein [Clostridium sp.]MCI1871626.1 dimethylarginine dimethylaminohydrolase family protein [Clostridium sp
MRKISGYFVKNSVGLLKKVLMCPPAYAVSKKMINGREIQIDNNLCAREHAELVNAYRSNGVEVVLMTPDEKLKDQVFSRDFGACIKEGYILGGFKHDGRKGETTAYEKKMGNMGIPCIARCSIGIFEGGDFWMLDENTIAIGVLERTDETGVDEIRRQIEKYGYSVISVPSPEKCLHLDMCFNMISEKLAVACREVLPDSFLKILKDRNFQIIDVDRSGLLKCCCNLQALGNDRVVSFKNNKKVNDELRANGIDVIEVDINEMFKHGGGIHCMTFPLSR